jgi:hypothetical protein
MNIVPLLGIVTIALLLCTAASGLMGVKLQWHKALAFITVAVALVHGGIVISKILGR